MACKVCEKIVKQRMIIFCQDLGGLNEIQFRFLEGKINCNTAVNMLQRLGLVQNTCTPTDIVFLDFTKAFDSVPHERLLLKLKGYGIEGNLLQNFLTNRQHRVVVRGTISSWSSVRSGVPQGTILGLILFLIYVNDISFTSRQLLNSLPMTQKYTERLPTV